MAHRMSEKGKVVDKSESVDGTLSTGSLSTKTDDEIWDQKK